MKEQRLLQIIGLIVRCVHNTNVKFEETDKAQSIDEFIDVCKYLDAYSIIEHAYELFEYLTIESIREQIYALSDPETPEPFRNAMCKLGFTDY